MPQTIVCTSCDDDLIKFDIWNIKKKDINISKSKKEFNEWEIWFLSLWKNIGFEEDWKWDNLSRPILIIKKFNTYVFYWIPLTSVKKENKFHYWFDWKTWKKSYAILSQMRLFDSKRLEEHIWNISFANMKELKKQLKRLIF